MGLIKIKKLIKNIVSTVMIGLVAVMFIGCGDSKEYMTKEEYNKVLEYVSLDCGMDVYTLENTLIKFAYKVYNPQSEKDILNGIDLLKGITTEAEYNELVSIAGKYDNKKKVAISNVNANYYYGENSSDGMSGVQVQFTLTSNGSSQTTLVQFVFNPDGKIFKHYIMESSITGGE